MTTTLIRNADVAIVWDAGAKQHTYLPDADIAFEDGKLDLRRPRLCRPGRRDHLAAAA